jgi:hypothetical protein
VSGGWRATATQQPAGRAGSNVVLVAALLGHARLDSTRRYSLASAANRAAMTQARP